MMRADNLKKIEKMALFSENWNGNGGKRFSIGAISMFKHVIQMLERQPQIAPTGRNSLLMQYESKDHSILAFELCEHQADMVYIPKGDYTRVQEAVLKDHVSQAICEKVEAFYGDK